MEKSKGYLVLIFLFIVVKGISQSINITPRYFISFTDKNNSPYSVNYPLDYLSPRAINRRDKQGIIITEQDLPVNPNYIDSVRNAGQVKVYYTSKWLNGVLISTTDTSALQAIQQFPFVQQSHKVRIKAHPNVPEQNKFEIEEEQKSFLPINVIPNYPYGHNFKEFKLHNGDVLHNLNFRGQGMHIAILDAGFYRADKLEALNHVFDEGRVLSTYDFVDNEDSVYEDSYHGCAVFSIIGGRIDGVFMGSAPMASFHLIRTEDALSEYIVEEYNWVFGAEYADSAGVDVINTSLGYTEFDNPSQNHTYPDMDGNTTIAAIGADIAASKGILLLASAGNQGGSTWQVIGTPADADSTLAVAAVDSNGTRAYFSSTGPSYDGDIKPNVASIGWYKYYVNPSDGRISRGNGTSFSSPFLTGFATCLWQAMPDKNNIEILNIIQASSSQFNSPDSLLGYGIPDFKKALEINTGLTTDTYTENTIENMYPNPVMNILNIVYQSMQDQTVGLQVFSMNGDLVIDEQFSVQKGRNLVQVNDFYTLAPGVYSLKLLDSEGSQIIKKIVVSTFNK